MKKTLIFTLLSSLSLVSYANNNVVGVRKEDQAKSVSSITSYWSAERMASATPLTPILSSTAGSSSRMMKDGIAMKKIGRRGSNPNPNRNLSVSQMVSPDMFENVSNEDVGTFAYGSFNAHYTSRRVAPYLNGNALQYSADTSYPYRAVGKLFFTGADGYNYVCSGSVIQKQIIVTAGHCLHNGDGTQEGFASNFLFVPAYHNGVAPYSVWDWSVVYTTLSWYNGGGSVPNAGDFGIIVSTDQTYNGVSNTKIGNVTGWLGWLTNSLSQNHATIIGYPVSFDYGRRMHECFSNAFRDTFPNNVEYGCDMTGGASGGPWVQNFGIVATGQNTGSNRLRNRVISVTSYGYVSGLPKVLGGSVLNDEFVNLYQYSCQENPGSC